ncbi:MAG: uncharacterized protein KVP18_003821 [Porospora cf. gigantea A]|uniref:uncharacterized protein n=1 Tax=Porospora cf. gigantea A TaxID=2853593 RepID=UPI00355A3833|nr:MAG: hypothetical protein KVP18_003821 [Porospora cf. gigantea A]
MGASKKKETSPVFLHMLSIVDTIDSKLLEVRPVAKLSEACRVRPIYVPLAVALILLLFLDKASQLITNLVGFCYPAWQSVKAIESGKDHSQWLTYWVVFAFISSCEIFVEFILHWVPFYYIIKSVFLLWLFLPTFSGATVVYRKILRPVFVRYESVVDE